MRTTHRVRRAGLALAAALLVAATACSDEPERADTESVAAGDNDAPSAVETDEADAERDADAGADEEDAEHTPTPAAEPPGEPLGSVTVPIGFIDGGELDMAVTDLSVTGDLMRVAIMFTASLPIEAEEVGIAAVLTANENAPAAGISPEVIDPANLKAYEAVAGTISNGTGIYLADGASRTLVFYFAAPQDQVETVDVVVSSQAPAITDIPFPQ